MADYQSEYTGPQIDEAIGRALPSGDLDVDIAALETGKEDAGTAAAAVTAHDADAGAHAALFGAIETGKEDAGVCMPKSGGAFTGNVKAKTGALTGGFCRNIFFSTVDPASTDGEIGDIWIVYEV